MESDNESEPVEDDEFEADDFEDEDKPYYGE